MPKNIAPAGRFRRSECRHIRLCSERDSHGLANIAHPQQLQPLRRVQALRAAAWDEAAREAEPVQLGQALIELVDGTDLTGQADLADGGERIGRRLVQRGGGDGDGDGQIGRRLVQPQSAEPNRRPPRFSSTASSMAARL